jgi:dihydrofolate reductase
VSSASLGRPLALIAAVPRNRVIGRDNALVWRHPDDLCWFRARTMGCPMVMGRRTWDSLPERFRPLPGRPNIVVTRQPGWHAPGAIVAPGLDEALAQADALAEALPDGAKCIVVMGGGQLYAQALPLADEMWLTEVDAELIGDTLFPAFERAEWQELSRLPHAADAHSAAAFDFVVYRRRRTAGP